MLRSNYVLQVVNDLEQISEVEEKQEEEELKQEDIDACSITGRYGGVSGKLIVVNKPLLR